MTEGRIVKPLSVFIMVVVVLLGGTVLLSLAAPGSTGPPDGERIDGQSPSQFRSESVNPAVDPEDGDISVDADGSDKRILVDTSHNNQVAEAKLEPVTEAVFEAGHTIEYGSGPSGSFEESLQGYDGVLIIQPLGSYSADEREALQEYVDDGGRVVFLAEPTQTELSTGFLTSTTTTVTFGANNATERFGVRMGAERLYNVDDEANDNNFKSIYATPSSDDQLTAGVDTVTFDTAGYAVTGADSDAETLLTAVDGTKTLETRRDGTYPTVVRTDNVVFVADASFMEQSEVYDADNEVFVGNLLTFLLGGDAPDPTAGDTDGDTTPTETETPTETTPEPTPTPDPTPTPGA